MVNIALSAVLTATQLLSWNALPLYVCLSADGSICVDFGPATCGCCGHDGPETGSCTARHDVHHDHDACETSAANSPDPCGCQHIQISEPQTAVLTRTATPGDAHRWVIPLPAIPSQVAAGCCLSPSDVPPGAPDHPASPRQTLSLLATVVMRC